MFKNLNIKKLAPGMNVREIAAIFHADIDHLQETEGREHLLEREEDEALTKACQDKGEIPTLNRLATMYNRTNQLLNSICAYCTWFQLCTTRISNFIYTAFLLERIRNLEKGKKADDVIALFSPPERDGDDARIFQKREPNPILQRLFFDALKVNKHIRTTLHMIQFIAKEGRMEFVSGRRKEIITEAEELLKDFSERDVYKKILGVFKDMYDHGLMRKSNFTKPEFLQLMLDFDGSLELTPEEVLETEEYIRRRLDDD